MTTELGQHGQLVHDGQDQEQAPSLLEGKCDEIFIWFDLGLSKGRHDSLMVDEVR